MTGYRASAAHRRARLKDLDGVAVEGAPDLRQQFLPLGRIDIPVKDFADIDFEGREFAQRHFPLVLEFHGDVDIAAPPSIAPSDGTEQVQMRNPKTVEMVLIFAEIVNNIRQGRHRPGFPFEEFVDQAADQILDRHILAGGDFFDLPFFPSAIRSLFRAAGGYHGADRRKSD